MSYSSSAARPRARSRSMCATCRAKVEGRRAGGGTGNVLGSTRHDTAVHRQTDNRDSSCTPYGPFPFSSLPPKTCLASMHQTKRMLRYTYRAQTGKQPPTQTQQTKQHTTKSKTHHNKQKHTTKNKTHIHKYPSPSIAPLPSMSPAFLLLTYRPHCTTHPLKKQRCRYAHALQHLILS